MEIEVNERIVGIFALSSAICSHLISINHHDVKSPWYSNKWFWAGLLGSFPALIALLGHIYFTKRQPTA